MTTIDATRIIELWERQQEVYIEHRERRYAVLLEFLTELAPPAPRILDLACGPGSLGRRVIEQVPAASVHALDADPVLLHIGQAALGDMGGRLHWHRVDLRDPAWSDRFADASFDAVVSSTATHWLRGSELVAMYRNVARLLTAGGVVLNADYLPISDDTPTIRAACGTLDAARQQRATDGGSDSWQQWWDRLRTEPALVELFAERDHLFPPDAEQRHAPSLDLHRAALVDAGFAEVDIVWQDLHERLLVAVRAHAAASVERPTRCADGSTEEQT